MTSTLHINRLLLWGLAVAILMTLFALAPQVRGAHSLNPTLDAIYGSVRDSSGAPIANIRVHICGNPTAVPTPGSCPDLSDTNRTTNSNGHWRFNFVTNNGYYVAWTGSSTGANAQSVFHVAGQTLVPTIIDNSGTGTLNYQLYVDVVGDGAVGSSISGIDCGIGTTNDCSHYYIDGTIMSLTASPSAGKVFDSWEGDCSGTGTTCDLVVNREMWVTASFSQGGGSGNATGSISGTVTQADNDPSVGTLVKNEKLDNGGQVINIWTVVTDGFGNYVFDNLFFGNNYRISLPDHTDSTPINSQVSLSSSIPNRANVNFTVPDMFTGGSDPGSQEGNDGILWGFVYDIDGDPSPGVSIVVERMGVTGSGQVSVTNSTGKYIVNGLYWPATYRIDLLPVNGTDTPDHTRFLDAVSRSKRADFNIATDIVISGEEPNPVTTGENGTLSGTVSLLDGSAALGVTLRVFAYNGLTYRDVVVDVGTGTYSMSLSPGIWFVGYEIFDDGYGPVTLGDERTVTSGAATVHDIVIRRNASTVIVTVKKSNGTLFTGAWVSMSRFSLTAETGEVIADNSTLEQEWFGKETGFNGQATFRVPPGTWYIRAHAPLTVERINPPEAQIVISEGQSKQLTMQFRTRDATLKGRVLNNVTGAPVNAFVGAWSETGGFAEGRSTADGFYELRVLSGETWHVGAMANIDGILYVAHPVDVPVEVGAVAEQNLIVKRTEFNIPPPVTVTHSVAESFVAKLENATAFACEGGGCFDGDEPIEIRITPDVTTPDQGGTGVIGVAYEIEAFGANSGDEHTTLIKPARITIPYADNDIAERGVLERDLTIGFFDETKGVWIELTDCAVDTTQNLVTCTTDHLTRFALLTPAYAAIVGSTINEGDLVRGPDGVKVWIVNANRYKRHIFNPAVFSMYSHFVWNNIVEVSQATLDSYATSDLYRALGDEQVFLLEEVDESQGLANKRWLNFSPEEFFARGYDALQIFEINPVERDFYQEGDPIL